MSDYASHSPSPEADLLEFLVLTVFADLVRATFNKLGLALAAADSDLAGDVLTLELMMKALGTGK